MKNEIAKIESTQLDEVVKNSGLQIQEADEIKKSYLPFLSQLAEAQSEAAKINFENPSLLDEKIARELRLKTVKIRSGAEKLKDERKKMYLLRGNLEQASYNLIATSCKITEEIFFNVEKAREISEKKRKEQLRIDREEKLSPYTEAVALYPLGEMSEDQFNELYTGLRIAHENRIEAERKAEQERIEKEKAEAAERERIRLENIRLQKEAEEREKQIQAEREKARKEREEQERIAEAERKKQAEILANERAKAEAEKKEQERLADIERKKQAEILAEQKRKSDEEKRQLEEKALKEREERERLEAELKAKREAEEKAKKEAEAKLEAEKKAKAAADRKAKLAPDKNKLLAFMQAINDLPRPEVKSIEAANVAANANILLVKVANYIKENADKL